ncbi:MAG TPA: electron transfer flavoprotein subunit beta/FixA family protein [Chitinophagaceae bacterium]|nr:electron transfer flavoprotein subunit beta/FixA family protein [Chitinophagaceae bacterium]
MNILVCITKAPDTTTKVAFTDNNTVFNEAGVQWIINPYDEWYALVRALELKEAGTASAIHLITVGKVDTEPVIRKALALGGDEAIRIDADSTDGLSVARQIAEYAKSQSYDLILTGKESIDYGNGSVGAMIAELLDLPFVAQATRLDVQGNEVSLSREIEGGEEVLACNTPMVISCQKGMAEARIPNMRGIMAARTKPLKVLPAYSSETNTKILSYELPPQKSGVRMFGVEEMDDLVRLLHEEAKVI